MMLLPSIHKDLQGIRSKIKMVNPQAVADKEKKLCRTKSAVWSSVPKGCADNSTVEKRYPRCQTTKDSPARMNPLCSALSKTRGAGTLLILNQKATPPVRKRRTMKRFQKMLMQRNVANTL